jgi:flagellar hook protein FlgE
MAFQQGLSGMDAAQSALDVIGNDIANVATVGYKQSEAQFADVYARSLTGSGGVQIGIGTQVAAVVQQFTQGNVTITNNALDMAINGSGFFRMSQSGAISYSRNGQFQLDNNGFIVNNTGQRLTGFAADAAGNITAGVTTDLQISFADLSPRTTDAALMNVNLDSRDSVPSVAFSTTNPASYNDTTAMTVYDSLGNAHALSVYFVKTTTANVWDVYGALDGTALGAPTAIGTLTFDSSGAIDTTATTLPFNVSAPVSTGAVDPLAFTLDFTGSTQFGSAFGVNAISQDGFAPGRLAGLSIDETGLIQGRYTNGQSRSLGQIALANFTNPQGLQPLGNNQWAETSASGQPLVGTANTGTLGIVQSGAVEESNVDLTAELVNLIIAQRAFQANAQTIQTQDQILQTLVNIR